MTMPSEAPSVALTIDVEWGTPQTIRILLDLLDEFKVRATMFSTHADGFDMGDHERALHPNFLDRSKTEQDILDSLASLYPDAVGIRSHALYIHGQLRQLYKPHQIQYESNYSMFGRQEIQPFEMDDGTVQFPVTFSDGGWFNRKSRGVQLPDARTIASWEGFQTHLFHPMHVAFNTSSAEFYAANKHLYWDSDVEPEEHKSADYGTADLLRDLLTAWEDLGHQPMLLRDATRQHHEANE